MSESGTAGRDYSPATIAIVAALLIALGALLVGLLDRPGTPDMASTLRANEGTPAALTDGKPEQSSTGSRWTAEQDGADRPDTQYAADRPKQNRTADVVGASKEPL